MINRLANLGQRVRPIFGGLQKRTRLRVLLLALVTGSMAGLPPTLSTAHAFVSNPMAFASPLQPLLGWSVAPDGALFVVDARHVLYELDATTLAPLRHSAPLLTGFGAERAYLVATDNALWLSSALLGKTQQVRRRDFQPLVMLDHFGPLAVDPGRRLFVVHNAALWTYDLRDLDATPFALIPPWSARQFSGERALDVAVNPAAKLLYATTYGAFGSSPHNPELLHRYDLATLDELGSESFSGHLVIPAVAHDAGSAAALFLAKSGLLGSRLLRWASDGPPPAEWGPLTGTALALSPDGQQLYLARDRGLWLLDGRDGSLISVLPFLQPPPTALLLSPDASRLYLFGNGWNSVIATAELLEMGLTTVHEVPHFWREKSDQAYDESFQRYHSSTTGAVKPTQAQFLILGGELYRALDGGQSWQFDPFFTYPRFRPLVHLSLSPEFATDQTVVAHSPLAQTLFRSTDGGQTWATWLPQIAFTSDRAGNRDIYVAAYSATPEGDAATDPSNRTPQAITNDPADDENPAWSPGWTRIVFQSNRTGNWDLFSVRADCDPSNPDICDLRQLTDDPADDLLPAWSPDGQTIAFVSLRDGNAEIYRMNADGSEEQRITVNPSGDWRPAWRPDGTLLFTSDRMENNDIYALSLSGLTAGVEPPVTPLIATDADERDVAVNSRGDLLFRSDHDGALTVYRLSADRLARQQLGFVDEPFDPYAYAYDKAALPSGHPTWITVGGEEDVLLSAELVATAGGATSAVIYQVPAYALNNMQRYATRYDTVGWEGQPAGGPVWWAGER